MDTPEKRFLSLAYPKDILVGKGRCEPKRTPFAWNAPDDGVSLHDLCVVVVNDRGLADRLENEFGILKTVPREDVGSKTVRYWFERSLEVDVLEYATCYEATYSGIGFVSFEPDGSGSIVPFAKEEVVWARSLAKCSVQVIPRELLDTVAVPRKNKMATKKTLMMMEGGKDGERVEMSASDRKWLHAMRYFDPFLDDSFDDDEPIPVPCGRTVFADLLCVIETLSLDPLKMSRTYFADTMRVADKLSAHPRVMRLFETGVPRLQLDIYEACPEWWSAMCLERSCREGRIGDGILTVVDEKLASRTKYVPLPRNERWLFHAQDLPCVPGSDVIVSDPVQALRDALPVEVKNLLMMFPGVLVLAGGAVLGHVSCSVAKGNDYDMFIVGVGDAEASRVLDMIHGTLAGRLRKLVRTDRAVTFGISRSSGDYCEIQVIFKSSDTVSRLLSNFDLDPCKVAVWANLYAGLVVACAPGWIPAMTHLAFPVDVSRWTNSVPSRVFKYYHKGFDVYIPGHARSAVMDVVMEMDVDMDGEFEQLELSGMAELLVQEARTLSWRAARGSHRMTICEFRRVSKSLRFRSDYDDDMNGVRNATYDFVNAGTTWIPVLKCLLGDDNKYVWRRAFGPYAQSDVRMHRAYDMDALARCLSVPHVA